ncbi:MAG: alkaline phosphatase family protein [Acetobacteraceae bacterium]|nr:alkaline phosphatase family protein [Acetobacteraceae bacterium]
MRQGTLAAVAVAAMAGAFIPLPSQANGSGRYQHVLLISVDGMHAVDLQRYITDPAHAGSALASLSRHALTYPNALTTAPSDSFPGMIAQVTGGTPKSTGVFYDDSYDRLMFAPGSNCAGPPGAETQFAENIDKDSSVLDAGGTLGQPLTQIDPAQLPLQLVSGKCVPVYPHDFIRVNTLFEVIRAHGGRTAWSDKHPAYDILNGPSGQGIQDLFTPEINSLIPPPGGDGKTDLTGSYRATRDYDQVKVEAVLNQIAGLDSTGAQQVGVPTILGMNFQAVSVGQKLAKSGPTDEPGLTGGYLDANATPGNALAQQLAYVDGAIGSMVQKLQDQGLYDQTLIIVSAKHGQSPIDPSLRKAIDGKPFTATPGYAHDIQDDVNLMWLQPETRADTLGPALDYLKSQSAALAIKYILTPEVLAKLYQDPLTDSRTPDFISLPQHGVIYTTGSKLAEHGGFSLDDRNVALLVSAPDIAPSAVGTPVETTQIAPTILRAFGLDPTELSAVRQERTKSLPGMFADKDWWVDGE